VSTLARSAVWAAICGEGQPSPAGCFDEGISCIVAGLRSQLGASNRILAFVARHRKLSNGTCRYYDSRVEQQIEDSAATVHLTKPMRSVAPYMESRLSTSGTLGPISLPTSFEDGGSEAFYPFPGRRF